MKIFDHVGLDPIEIEEPALPAAWIIREAGATPRKYRVIGLNEDDNVITVLASAYYEDKYAIVDDFTKLSSETTSIAGLTITPMVSAGSVVLKVT